MNIAATLPVEKKRWGFWATLGFSLVIIGAYILAQGFAIGLVAGIQSLGGTGLDEEELLEAIENNGFYLSIGSIASAWVGALVIGAVILLRKGYSLKEYLAVRKVPFKTYAIWLLAGLVFLVSWEGLNVAFDQPGSDWMTDTYETAEYTPLIWITFVIAAPLIEELFFRGFLFEGLRDSWMGPIGAVLVTSVGWAAIHGQYELFQIIMIGMLGILLGIAKLKTRSLYITLAMHSLHNLIATFQVATTLDS